MSIARWEPLPKDMLRVAKEEINEKYKKGEITKEVAEWELKKLDEQLKEENTK